MYQPLNQSEIGRRIAALRKQRGLSQEALANQIHVSRSSLTQMELGNRSVDLQELQALAQVLRFSYDDFLSQSYASESTSMVHEPIELTYRSPVRNPKASLRSTKIYQILLYLLEQTAGKPNVGESHLWGLLYFADFNYYEIYEEHLTGMEYRKLPFGQVPLEWDAVIQNMIQENILFKITTNYQSNHQIRLIPLTRSNLSELRASEIVVIDQVIQNMGNWSTNALDRFIRSDMPWVATKEGEIINYELALYREPPYAVRNYDLEEEA
ncbi:MAG: type II toxin-antitoxin system antitoxin SocA domain-containing protein [Bacteroidota bacterium]